MSAGCTLLAIGDMLPTRVPLSSGDPGADGFHEVCERIRAADLAVGTLDLPLSTRGVPAEKLVPLRASPALAGALRDMGFDVLSLANNHAMDYGEPGLVDTLQALESAGIESVGAGLDVDAAAAPVVRELGGRRVAVFAWSCLLPTGSSASEERPGVTPLHVHVSYELDPYVQMEEPTYPPTIRSRVDDRDLGAATARIEAARGDSDFVVVLVHWGVGDSDELSEYQRPLAHAFVDAGADLVVGSHPHRVHGIEVYEGKVVLYSAGTLIDQLPREGLPPDLERFMELMSPDGYLASLDVAGSSSEVAITPVTQSADGTPALARGEEFERIAERLTRMSSELGTRLDVRAGQLFVA